jgi:hypothetical protein
MRTIYEAMPDNRLQETRRRRRVLEAIRWVANTERGT